jgi:hypothetical protein
MPRGGGVKWALDTLKVEACKDDETKAFGSPRVELRAFPCSRAQRHLAVGTCVGGMLHAEQGRTGTRCFPFILDFCLQSSCEVK